MCERCGNFYQEDTLLDNLVKRIILTWQTDDDPDDYVFGKTTTEVPLGDLETESHWSRPLFSVPDSKFTTWEIQCILISISNTEVTV